MTPRERAIESLTLLRQNASKRNATYSQCFLDDMADVIEQAIIADQQALQSEMKQKIDEYSSDLPSVKERMLHIVQVVFAQQSQPEELKPERLMISQEEFNRCIKQANENYREAERRYQACYTELTKTQAESDRRVFAQQSQPEEPNPDMISKSACDRLSAERIEKVLAESDRRVLA